MTGRESSPESACAGSCWTNWKRPAWMHGAPHDRKEVSPSTPSTIYSRSMSIHFLNGQLVTETELRLSPRDLGFTRGYAVFDFLITYHGKPFMLDWHIERLLNSAKQIGLAVPWSKTQIH